MPNPGFTQKVYREWLPLGQGKNWGELFPVGWSHVVSGLDHETGEDLGCWAGE